MLHTNYMAQLSVCQQHFEHWHACHSLDTVDCLLSHDLQHFIACQIARLHCLQIKKLP